MKSRLFSNQLKLKEDRERGMDSELYCRLGKVLAQRILFMIEVTLLGSYHKSNGTLTQPPLSPPSSIIQTVPQMSTWCCHVKLRPIGCNQEKRQARPLSEWVTSTPPPSPWSGLFSLHEPHVLFPISGHTHWPCHFSPR